jgi:hypothetical protein
MREAAEPSLRQPQQPVDTPSLRVLPVDPAENERREALIHRLAADRLRDLRDDGVTLAYLARMYDVEEGLLERVLGELVPTRRG